MKIRLLVSLSGPLFTLNPGDEQEFDDAEAIRLIEAGYAAPVAEAETERAVRKPAPERRPRS